MKNETITKQRAEELMMLCNQSAFGPNSRCDNIKPETEGERASQKDLEREPKRFVLLLFNSLRYKERESRRMSEEKEEQRRSRRDRGSLNTTSKAFPLSGLPRTRGPIKERLQRLTRERETLA